MARPEGATGRPDGADWWPDAATPGSGELRVAVAGARTRLVWRNEGGCLTYVLVGATGRRYLKWSPSSSGDDPRDEARRSDWARPFAAVPYRLLWDAFP